MTREPRDLLTNEDLCRLLQNMRMLEDVDPRLHTVVDLETLRSFEEDFACVLHDDLLAVMASQSPRLTRDCGVHPSSLHTLNLGLHPRGEEGDRQRTPYIAVGRVRGVVRRVQDPYLCLERARASDGETTLHLQPEGEESPKAKVRLVDWLRQEVKSLQREVTVALELRPFIPRLDRERVVADAESASFVRHTKRPEWGFGRICSRRPDGKVDILFEQAGMKAFLPGLAALQSVDPREVPPDSAARREEGSGAVPPRREAPLAAVPAPQLLRAFRFKLKRANDAYFRPRTGIKRSETPEERATALRLARLTRDLTLLCGLDADDLDRVSKEELKRISARHTLVEVLESLAVRLTRANPGEVDRLRVVRDRTSALRLLETLLDTERDPRPGWMLDALKDGACISVLAALADEG